MNDKRILDSVCFENGHYVIGMTFKSENVIIPNNKKQAEQRSKSFVMDMRKETKDLHQDV